MAETIDARAMLNRYISLKRALDDAYAEAQALGMESVAMEVAAAREALVGNTIQLGPIMFASSKVAPDVEETKIISGE